MAQPTDAEQAFEVSDPSDTVPVPTLSRYARPDGGDTNGRAREPIVENASLRWNTAPSPPLTVRGSAPAASDLHFEAPDNAEAQPTLNALLATAAPAPAADDAKRPFWKRLSMARPGRRPDAAGESLAAALPVLPPDRSEEIIGRIDHLARRFENEQKGMRERIDLFEHNLTQLWELEEQLSLTEVHERLAVLQANQEDIADGLHALARNLAIGAGLLTLALGALGLLLLL